MQMSWQQIDGSSCGIFRIIYVCQYNIWLKLDQSQYISPQMWLQL